MPERVLNLQRALVEAALMPSLDPLAEDPRGFAARFGLNPLDQAAFARFAKRLPAYRELVRMNLTDPIEAMFPVTHALLDQAELWEACVAAFMDARVVVSPHYRDVAPAFLGWLADTGWGQARWPCLLQLAHFELLENLVERHPPAETPRWLHATPQARDQVVLDPATQVVAYQFAVTEATPEAPLPRPHPLQLMAYRDPEGEIHWLTLTPATAALVLRAQNAPIQDAAQALGLEDLTATLTLLRDFRLRGAILGFHTPPRQLV